MRTDHVRMHVCMPCLHMPACMWPPPTDHASNDEWVLGGTEELMRHDATADEHLPLTYLQVHEGTSAMPIGVHEGAQTQNTTGTQATQSKMN